MATSSSAAALARPTREISSWRITDDGEATLKYWFPEANRIRLQPANSSMKPIYSRTAQVIGIVTGVVRRVV